MTTNAVPSSAAEDLLLNAQALDQFINSDLDSMVTRLGVTKETLKGAVSALRFFNNRGNWAAMTGYALKDLVLFSGTWYVCIEAHISGAAFSTNAAKFVVHQTSLVVSTLMQSLLDDTTTDQAQSTLGGTAVGKAVFGAENQAAARAAIGAGTANAGPLSGSGITGAAASGANVDIYSLMGVSVGRGGGQVSTNSRYGYSALESNTSGGWNSALGFEALLSCTSASQNVAIGHSAAKYLTVGDKNTCIGMQAGISMTSGALNVAIGYSAHTNPNNFSNSSCIGSNSDVSGSNQVQLGSSGTTTYVYGTVQNRSDLRDKADVRDTVLGLDFISALRPVDYKWDMREDYRPDRPVEPPEGATEEQVATYQASLESWLHAVKHENLVRDGSKKRTRYHHGFIAQEVKALIDFSGVDFGGFQDHKVAGGDDVLSIGYDELIAPLVKSVQQLAEKNAVLEQRLAALEQQA
jgi:hypothetical protein